MTPHSVRTPPSLASPPPPLPPPHAPPLTPLTAPSAPSGGRYISELFYMNPSNRTLRLSLLSINIFCIIASLR